MEQLNSGDIAINSYGQEVEILDISNNEVVLLWIEQDSIDVLNIRKNKTL